ncbi:hypothetical protein THARTR1_11102 [Trichoderma harzianum]|uniref:Uncharacterized protein n=1 Tax=Trichoderma harzianum TaxID=5544 RepID=A0A2K0TFA8_TRIHA|nr:hypothetical protein THARTR1_11102 [Trichoderma harzianum]
MSKIQIQEQSAMEPQPVGAADAGVVEQSAPLEQAQDNGQDDSNAPPDGGLQAWLQVVASFALYFNHLYGPMYFVKEWL